MRDPDHSKSQDSLSLAEWNTPEIRALPVDQQLTYLRGIPREERNTRLAELADEAMADPRFVADMQETMEAFRYVDAEHWPSYNDQ
jgi:hypothetical protein